MEENEAQAWLINWIAYYNREIDISLANAMTRSHPVICALYFFKQRFESCLEALMARGMTPEVDLRVQRLGIAVIAQDPPPLRNLQSPAFMTKPKRRWLAHH